MYVVDVIVSFQVISYGHSKISGGGKLQVLVMDFAKAFDKVCHRLLIHKLHRYVIQGKVNQWIESLLADRTQSESELELLLVTRRNDNHSPGPVIREVSP